MGCTSKTSFCSRVTFSMRSPVAMSNGCAPVCASYSAIILFTSSMSTVAGSYSRSVLSPSDENVRILALMFGLLRDVSFRFPVEKQSEVLGSLRSYCTVSRSCQVSFSGQMIRRSRPSFPPSLADSKQHYRTVFEMPREKKILSATHDRSQRKETVKYDDD